MSQQPQRNTPLMNLYLDAQSESIQNELKRARQKKLSREERTHLLVLNAMMQASLDHALIVKNSADQEREIQAAAGPLDLAPANVWLEPYQPLSINSTKKISALFLSCSGDPDAISHVAAQFPDERRGIEKLAAYSARWMVDCVDAVGEIRFGFVYRSDALAETQRWQSSHEVELCPWMQCSQRSNGTFQECARCAVLRQSLAQYVCSALKIHNVVGVDTAARPAHLAGEVEPSAQLELKHEETRLNTSDLRRLEASGMPAFLAQYKATMHSQIETMKQRGERSFTINAHRLLLIFQVETMKSSKIILVPSHVQDMIERKIAEFGGLDGDHVLSLRPEVSRNLWIHLERPLQMYSSDWQTEILFLSQSNDIRVIDRIKPLFAHDKALLEVAEQLRDEKSQFAVDAIDMDTNSVKMSVEYEPGLAFRAACDHRCSFQVSGCGKRGQYCPRCKKISQQISGYFCMILLAQRGEFAEIVVEEDTERVKREEPDIPGAARRPGQKGKKQKRQPSTWEDRTVYTLTVKVSERVIEETEEEREEREGHPNWMKLHTQEEIESYKAVQGPYERNGKIITPKVERPYYKLKNSLPIEEMK